MRDRNGEPLCGCQAAEAAFRRGFRAGAEFVLQMAGGERGEMAHAMARAMMLSRAVGKPITAALIMGALADAVEALQMRVSLLLESEGRSRWRQLLAGDGAGGGHHAGGEEVPQAAGGHGLRPGRQG